jgi:hypothetical protein
LSGRGDDEDFGDSDDGEGTGDDMIVTDQGDDTSYGDTRSGGSDNDRIITGQGEDTVTDYNPDEGDIAIPDCENIS